VLCGTGREVGSAPLSGLGRFRGRIAVLSGVIVVLLAAGTWVALTTASAKSTGSHATAQHRAAKARVTAQKAALTVASTSPEQHAQNVNGTSPIEVHFSAPLADGAPMPTITPSVAGTWSRVGTAGTIEFTPAQGFPANTFVQVHIPSGLKAKGGGELAAPATMYFHTGAYAAARLPELLAQLGYLPLTWAPFAGQASPALGNAAAQLAAAYSAPAGSFTWQPGYPPGLTAFWDNGSPDGLILHGAIMAFESNVGLTMDGVAGPQVWAALLAAADASKTNPNGYTYAVASQVYPETLTVYHDGKVILHTPANTGIPAAPTTVGTAPVYERLQSQIMKGLNPDGTKYADQVYWVSYFRAGEAVHYFPRGSYGYQQSLGCVELPYSTAKYIWPYLTYGTLVTVTPT
jgi:peptidoglycan hydrolase-like protein with peptidoglycan-binding domain